MPFVRTGDCQHPLFSDEDIVENEKLIMRTTGDAPALKCPNCNEWLYPSGDPDDDGTVDIEPRGAGNDYPW